MWFEFIFEQPYLTNVYNYNKDFAELKRLSREYYQGNDALYLAEDLLGKYLVRKFDDGEILRLPITETEAYLGSDDLASHASKGRTPRTEIMFAKGGYIYAYLIYGMYWMLNIVTGPPEHPQAVLIRGVQGITGPGRVGKAIKLDRSFYGEDLSTSPRIWLEDNSLKGNILTSPRIGVDYAGEVWSNKPWRFVLE